METANNLPGILENLIPTISWVLFIGGVLLLVWKLIPSREDIDNLFDDEEDREPLAEADAPRDQRSERRPKHFGVSANHPHNQ